MKDHDGENFKIEKVTQRVMSCREVKWDKNLYAYLGLVTQISLVN